ncbi:MAG: rhomboid family intramembrane serine protease [Treponema sp.]|jgi:membrane associated rhomboid family serine protease|nr:rhomboid family intramembrane serine protease [Treponema sp.]
MRTSSYSYKNTVLILIGINILVFFVQQLMPPVTVLLSLNPRAILNGWLWGFVSYMFVHGTIGHLLCNMLALFIFGIAVEQNLGTKEFLIYYFITGIFAGLFSFGIYLLTGAYNVFLLGASGALFAVQLAYAVLFPDSIIYFWGIVPLRAPVMVLGFTAIELILTVMNRQSGVAHLTHLAGFATGWLYFLIRFRRNPWKSMHLLSRH